MSDPRKPGVPFASDDSEEQQLWQSLQDVPQAEPPPRLRRKFYDELDKVSRQTRLDRWRQWFGLAGARGFATAAACVVVGVSVGTAWDPGAVEHEDLTDLQQQVAQLNRNLILDRLASDSPNKRLLGVIDAARVAADDSEIAHALLTRAVDDRVYSVRAAAIDAIGPQLNTSAMGDDLMALLTKTESPIVQLALVDLVLRHGNAQQIEQLLQLTERGALHPDLAQHVKSAMGRKPV